MVNIKDVPEKITPAKKSIEVKDIVVKASTFVDKDGVDVTKDILVALGNIETISFKFALELPTDSDNDSEDE